MSNTRFKILALQIFLIDFIKVQTAINPDNLETICITLKLSGQCWNYLDSNETAQTLSKLIWNCLEIIISTSIHHNFWRLSELPTEQCPKTIWDVRTKLGFLIEYLYNILDSQNLFGLLPGFFGLGGWESRNFLKCQDFESACYSLSCLTYAMKITYANAFSFCFYGSVCDCCKCFSPQSHMECQQRLNVEGINILGQHTIAKYKLTMRFVLT